MSQRDTVFVVPTYRLREVGETIESYDANIKNRHQLPCVRVENREPVS